MRASWFVSAIFWKQRRNKPLVDFYKNNQRKSDDFINCYFQNITKLNINLKVAFQFQYFLTLKPKLKS